MTPSNNIYADSIPEIKELSVPVKYSNTLIIEFRLMKAITKQYKHK